MVAKATVLRQLPRRGLQTKPRALTYTEMMNCCRQQMDEAEHAREQEMKRRVEDLEKNVDRLEQALKK